MYKFEKRFNHDADTHEEARHYIKNRAKQLHYVGYKLTSLRNIPEGVISIWSGIDRNGASPSIFVSIYLFPKSRGKGNYERIYINYNKNFISPVPVLTVRDCQLEDFLKKKKFPYVLVGAIMDTPEYQAIQKHYGDQKASRSGVFLMNHIDEGIAYLHNYGKSADSLRAIRASLAFILHPLVQCNDDLLATLSTSNKLKDCMTTSILRAMEYRHVANSYLSTTQIEPKDVKLGPVEEVRLMLLADKIQNYKDFLKYHQHTHERRHELAQYFLNWFGILGITLSQVNEEIQELEYLDSL